MRPEKISLFLVLAAFPTGWFALRAVMPAPPGECTNPAHGHGGEGARRELASGELDSLADDSDPRLLEREANRLAWRVDRTRLAEEAERLWREARPLELDE